MKLHVSVESFAYPGQQTLLRDVRFHLSGGNVLAILGPNGVGKTTLVKCMLGLLPHFRGSSLLDGQDTRTLPPRRVWKAIGYVPQARGYQSSLLVEDMILLGRNAQVGLLHQPGPEDLAAVRREMEALGIEGLRGQPCATLSGGQLQMALMARALCHDPELLVLDEPESSLDYQNQVTILRHILDLSHRGIGSLFITHFPQHALQIADLSLLLFPDGTYAFGPTRDVLTPDHLQRAYGVRAQIEYVPSPGGAYPFILIEDMPLRSEENLQTPL